MEVEAEIEFSQSSLNVRSTGETSAIVVTTNVPWTASSDASWCRINPEKGPAGSTAVEIIIDPQVDGGYEDRECRITFIAGSTKSEITVLQRQKNALILSTKVFELDNLSHEITIELQTNVECGLRIYSGWVSAVEPPAQTRELETLSRTFFVEANLEVDPRSTMIEVMALDSPLTDTIYISQLGADLYTQEEFLALDQLGYYVSKDSAIIYNLGVDQLAWNLEQLSFRIQDYMQSKLFEIILSEAPQADSRGLSVDVVTIAPRREDPFAETFSVDVLNLSGDKAKLWDQERKRGFIIKYK